MPIRESYTLPNKDELSDAYKAFLATMQQHMAQQSQEPQQYAPLPQPQQPPPQGLQNLIDMLMNRGQQ